MIIIYQSGFYPAFRFARLLYLSRAAGLGSSVSPLSRGPNLSPLPSPRGPAPLHAFPCNTNIQKLFEFTKFYLSFLRVFMFFYGTILAKFLQKIGPFLWQTGTI